MIGEFNLFGVYVAAAVVTAGIAGALLLLATRMMRQMNVYRFFVNPRLVDLAVFVILWASVSRLIALFRSF